MSFWQTNNRQSLILKSGMAEKIFEIDGVFLEKRSIGFGFFGIFAIGVSNNQKINQEKLINLCKIEKCLFLQIETFEINEDSKKLENLKNFKNGYYKKFITPYSAIIDLSKSIDDILNDMKPKGRYNIKLAQKKGVIVFEAEKNKENIKIFYDLLIETTKRDNFNGNNLNYYIDFLEIENSGLVLAKYEEKIIAGGIFIFNKNESIYYYGASTSDKEYRNLMAPYLVQFFAISKAKDFGSNYYDFLGVATPGDENSHLNGVTDFKTKFTQNIKEVSKSYIYINNNILYKIIFFLRNLK